MLHVVLGLILAISAVIVVYYAYTKESNLAKLSSFVILAALLLTAILTGIAGMFTEAGFLDALASFLNSLAGFVGYAEIVLLLVLLFLSPYKSKSTTLKAALGIYLVVQFMLTLGLF